MALFLLQGRRQIKSLLQKNNYDLIHAHAIIPDGLLARFASNRSGTPYVITAHGSDVPGYNPDQYGFTHWLAGKCWRGSLQQAAAVVTPSNHLANLIRKQRPGFPVTVIPNGIDVNILCPKEKNRQFLIVSRLVRRKNYDLFLEGLAGIKEPQEVHIVGQGPMQDELKAIAEKIPQHDIRFHGWLVNGSRPWQELFETSRFFVFPSSSENFPINLLEAQLAGLVVLASDIEGNREVLGEQAVYFSELTSEGIGRTLREVLGWSDSEYEALGNKARQRVVDNFSWTAIVNSYNRVFEKIWH
jgi:glycosyltransferase involved in cell wall biosynthesis